VINGQYVGIEVKRRAVGSQIIRRSSGEARGGRSWCIANSLATTGRFVSVEMFTTSAGVLWWANAIKDAGLNVNWAKVSSFVISSMVKTLRQ
jgi:hypothetical protein